MTSRRLHVERTAAEDVATGPRAGERRIRPLGGDGRHDVDVVQQEERLFVRVGGEPRVDRLPLGIAADERRRDALLHQELLQVSGAGRLAARRIRRVDAKVGDQRLFRLPISGILRHRRGAPALQRPEEQYGGKQQDRPSVTKVHQGGEYSCACGGGCRWGDGWVPRG